MNIVGEDKNGKEKKIVLIASIALVAIILLVGITYALNYAQTSSNQQLILGDIWMNYAESNSLTIEDAMPGSDYTNYFEFTISGKNTYTKKDIWYEIVLTKGDKPDDKDENYRIPDKYIKFKLVSVNDNDQETEIFTDKKYGDLTNKRVHVETIPKNTPEVNKTYRLYMTIDDSLIIGNTSNALYELNEWEQAFASVKVNVTGDLTEKEVENDTDSSSENAVGTIKANVVSYSVSSASDFTGGLVGINTSGTLYNETTSEEVREYRYSGADVDNYIYYNCPDTANCKNYGDLDYDYANNCEVWRIVGIFYENGEQFLKIMNNNTLTDIPTTYVIDGTTYLLGYDGYGTYAYPISAYWNAPDSLKSTNYNDWTTAGLQYYLNTEQDDSATPVAGYLSRLSTNAKNLIRETTYYLGNINSSIDTTISAYAKERNSENICEGNEATWNGKVALLYPSDYGYSASNIYWETVMYDWKNAELDGIIASSTSWMMQNANHISHEWLLSPSYHTNNDDALYWDSKGYVSFAVIDDAKRVRGVLNLKSNTKVLKGDGDVNSPYVVVEG